MGRTVGEVLALPAYEFAVWADYAATVGLPADRAEWATAIGAAYLCSAWGGKAAPADLIPRFEQPETREAKLARLAAFFDRVGSPEADAGTNG